MSRISPELATKEIWTEKFPEAKVIFLAGSVMRGEGTDSSDLDLVVVFEKVDRAYRDSFNYKGWPVEVFIHDPETLKYFFDETDLTTGIPALANMVFEGKEVPSPSEFSQSMKNLAKTVLDKGPKVWTEDDFKKVRYMITDVCEDLRSPRCHAELYASAMKLYELMGDFYFRSRGQWSAKGKSLPRKLKKVDPKFFEQFDNAFNKVFKDGKPNAALDLAESNLKPFGGFLFAGHKMDAPVTWRKPLSIRLPVLNSERLTLRLAIMNDAKAILEYFTLNQTHFEPTDPPKPQDFFTEEFWLKKIATSLEEFNNKQAIRFFVIEKSNPGTIIGTVNFTQFVRGPFQACYLGFGIGKNRQGMGLMREAIDLGIKYAFETLNIHRIMANHLTENQRSANILKRLGFVREGEAKEYLFINEKWRDHVLNSLTNPTWCKDER